MEGSRPPRLPLVDGVRAIAALCVFGTHVGQSTGFSVRSDVGPLFVRMNVGVAMFFVLSGFLLHRPWVRARLDGRSAPDVGRYALRRAARILPAYWVALLVLGALLPAEAPGVYGDRFLVHFGLLQVYDVADLTRGLGVAWSLGTEVAFYALLPLVAALLALALGRRRRTEQVRLELAALAASGLVGVLVVAYADPARLVATWSATLPGTWLWFACGMALAVLGVASEGPARPPRATRLVRRHPWWPWIAAAGLMGVAAFSGLLPATAYAPVSGTRRGLEQVLYALIAVGVLAPAALGDPATRRGPARVLALRPVAWLGLVSYGIFLWHLPLVGWTIDWTGSSSPLVVGPVALACSVAAAALSWYLVERPILQRVVHRAVRRPDRAVEPGAPVVEPAP